MAQAPELGAYGDSEVNKDSAAGLRAVGIGPCIIWTGTGMI